MSNKTRAQKYLQRIQKEIEAIRTEKCYESIEILDLDPDYRSVTLAFAGPIDSPYEGYCFRILVEWPIDYPFRTPKFTLKDRIWNPYVDFQHGSICADLLEEECSPALTTQKYILSICSLLGETKVLGEHNGFLNPEAASQMITNYYEFSDQAKKWCKLYAFKQNKIYQNIKRGKPEEHQVKAKGEEFKKIVKEKSKDPKMVKKKRKITKRTLQQRQRQTRLHNYPRFLLRNERIQ